MTLFEVALVVALAGVVAELVGVFAGWHPPAF